MSEEHRAELMPSEAERLGLLREGTSLAQLAVMKVDLPSGKAIWSEGMWALLDMEPGSIEPTRTAFTDLIHPHDRVRTRALAKVFMETGEPRGGSFRIQLKDGRVRHLETRTRVTEKAEGRPTAAVCVVQDVTASRVAEAALRASEEHFRSFFEYSGIGCALTAPDGCYLRVNRELCGLLGYREDELLGMHFAELTHPDDRAADDAAMQKVLAGELAVYRCEKRYLHKDGAAIWVALNVAPVRGHDGSIVSFSAQMKDIRDAKRTELALQDSERRSRMLATHVPVGIFEADGSGRCTFVNERWSELTGRSKEQALGQEWLEPVHPEDRTAVQREWQRAMQESSELTLEFRLLRPDERAVWVAAKALGLRDERSGAISYLGVASDITERKLAEQHVFDAVSAAEQAALAKSEFLARMSHEIRTPMNSVIGMTRLVLDSPLSEEQRDYLSMAHAAAKGLLRVINDILDFSKIEAGRLDLEQTAFEPRACMKEALRGLAHRAQQKGLDFEISIAEAVPRVMVGDPQRLQQVLLNLVGNAIKFTERGGVRVSMRLGARGAEHATLEFTVSDTGIGVLPEQQAQIFQAFAQADEDVSRKFGGTGLGLAICAQLVEMMNGTIWLESEPGRGSRFHFTIELALPRHDNSHTPLPFNALGDTGRMHEMGALPQVTPARILVAEDNAMNQRLVDALLRREGHTVVLVNSGRRALERLAAEPFDLVLMDVQMPEMSGIEAVRRLREREDKGGKRVPVIALTAQAMMGDRERCLAAGMDGYLSKPLSPSELRRCIAEFAHSPRHPVPEPAQKPVAPFNREALQRRLGHDQALYTEIVALFRRDSRALLRELEQRLVAEEREPAERLAHRLCGMLINIGATRAATLAKQIEGALQAGEWAMASAVLAELRREVQRVDSALDAPDDAIAKAADE